MTEWTSRWTPCRRTQKYSGNLLNIGSSKSGCIGDVVKRIKLSKTSLDVILSEMKIVLSKRKNFVRERKPFKSL